MKTTLAFSPTAYKTSKVYSVLPNDDTGDFSLTRASSATRVNKDGLIELVGSNVPRLDYSGGGCPTLLLERESTNLLPHSETFENWSGGSSHIVRIDGLLNPEGLNSAKLHRITTSSDNILLSTGKVASVKNYTGSVFVKKNDANYLAIREQGNYPSRLDMIFNFNTGELTGSTTSPFVLNDSRVEDYGNGWFRLSWNFDTGSNTFINLYMIPRESFGEIDATDTSDSVSCYIFGSQKEELQLTSYIPTSGAAITRNADWCVKENISTDIISSDYPFTMYAEAKVIFTANTTETYFLLTFGDLSVSYLLFTIILLNTGLVRFQARANNTIEQIDSSYLDIQDGDILKVAVTMENQTSGKIAVNGIVDSKSDFTSQVKNPVINDIIIGALREVDDTGTRIPIREVRLFDTALTEQELIDLTT